MAIRKSGLNYSATPYKEFGDVLRSIRETRWIRKLGSADDIITQEEHKKLHAIGPNQVKNLKRLTVLDVGLISNNTGYSTYERGIVLPSTETLGELIGILKVVESSDEYKQLLTIHAQLMEEKKVNWDTLLVPKPSECDKESIVRGGRVSKDSGYPSLRELAAMKRYILYLREHGVTHQDLEKELNISKNTLSQMISGSVSKLYFDRIVNALGFESNAAFCRVSDGLPVGHIRPETEGRARG